MIDEIVELHERGTFLLVNVTGRRSTAGQADLRWSDRRWSEGFAVATIEALATRTRCLPGPDDR